MLASSGSTFPTRERLESFGRVVPAARFGAAAVMALGALAFGAVGWSMAVLPSLRTVPSDQLSYALRLSSAAPLLLGAGAAHAVAAFLAASGSVVHRRWSAALAAAAALVTACLAASRIAAGPGGSGSALGAILPFVTLATAYAIVAAVQLASTRSAR